MKIGILGGGISGLSCGYFLSQNNIDFEILEKEPEAGGMCRSIRGDFTFDVVGGHIFFTKDKEVNDFILSLVPSLQKRRRNTKVFYKNLFVKYPFENGLADLPKQENFECLLEFIKTLNQNYEKPKNFQEWILQTFGKAIAEKYLLPYNKKIWNYPPEKMATFWVDGRVPKPPIKDIIKSSIGIPTEGYTHQLNFYYPENGGFQTSTDALHNKIRDKVKLNFTVKKIKKENGKWLVSNDYETREYDELISTVPLFVLQTSMDLPENISDAISKLKYNSVAVVMLGLDYEEPTHFHWLYIPDETTPTHKIIYLKNYSSKTSPKEKTSVMSEMTYNEGDNMSRMSDEELIDRIASDLHERKLIDKEKICYKKVCRTKYAYVVYDTDYEKNIKLIHNHFSSIGIHLCGRFSEFKYINADACIRSAKNIVDKLLASKNIKPKGMEELLIS